MATKPATKLVDALSARIHFGEMMEEAEKEKTRFLVSRRRKPKVVILSVEDYLKNVVKRPEILATIKLSAQKPGLDKMTDEEIEALILDTDQGPHNIQSWPHSKVRKLAPLCR